MKQGQWLSKPQGLGAARPPPTLPCVRAQRPVLPGWGAERGNPRRRGKGRRGWGKQGVSGFLSRPHGQHGQERSAALAAVHREERGAEVSGGHTTDEEEEQSGVLPLQGRDLRPREPGQDAPELMPPARNPPGCPSCPPHPLSSGARSGHSLLTTTCLLPVARGPDSSLGLSLPERGPAGPGSGCRSLGSTPAQSRGHCRVLPGCGLQPLLC